MTSTLDKTLAAAAIALTSLATMSGSASAGGRHFGHGGFHGGFNSGFGHGFQGGFHGGFNKFGHHRRCGFVKFGKFVPCR